MSTHRICCGILGGEIGSWHVLRRAGMLQIVVAHHQRPARQARRPAAATYSDLARDTVHDPRLLVVLDRRRPAHEPLRAKHKLRRRSHLFQPPSPLARMTVAPSRKLVAAARSRQPPRRLARGGPRRSEPQRMHAPPCRPQRRPRSALARSPRPTRRGRRHPAHPHKNKHRMTLPPATNCHPRAALTCPLASLSPAACVLASPRTGG